MLKLAGECIEGQMADHIAQLDAHTKDIFEATRTGEYFYHFPGIQTSILNADRMTALPLLVARDMTVDRIAIEVTTEAAGKKVRLGIYKDGANISPGALLLDAGEVNTDSVGIKEIAINQKLTKGRYWLTILSDGTPTVRALSYAYGVVTGRGILSTDFSRKIGGVYSDIAYGSLPDPFGDDTSYSSHTPMVLVRIASLD